MAEKKNKSAREKRVLIAALISAAVIVGGSTFAWFTSSDEVTNRLTASADYGVAITETFTPPSDWLPGQKILKEVAAVNTGNIDAFVRLDLKHDIKGTANGAGVAYEKDNVDTAQLAGKLSQEERILLQAGGYLAYTDAAGVEAGEINNSKSYTPNVKGLYIFRRQITDGFAYSGYYFDGTNYYGLVTTKLGNGELTVDAVLTTATPTPTNTGSVNDGELTAVSGVKLANTVELNAGTPTSNLAKKNDTTGEWETENVDWAHATHILVVYPGTKASADDDIIIALELNDEAKNKWTYISDLDGDKGFVNGHFYYNGILAPETTTEKLILSATLDDSVKSGAYLTMTYDLTVGLDSVQAAKGGDGKYSADTVKTWVNTADVNETTGAPDWQPAAAPSGD